MGTDITVSAEVMQFARENPLAPAEAAWNWGFARDFHAVAWADLAPMHKAEFEAHLAYDHAYAAALAKYTPPPEPEPVPVQPVDLEDTILAQNTSPLDRVSFAPNTEDRAPAAEEPAAEAPPEAGASKRKK